MQANCQDDIAAEQPRHEGVAEIDNDISKATLKKGIFFVRGRAT
jgi:hypothetical protein